MILGVFCLLLTIAIYYASKRLYQLSPKIYLTPLIVTPLVLILLLLLSHISLQTYNFGGKWITYMLQPATIAFAIPLYKYFDVLKKHATEIITSVLLGALVGMVSTAFIAKWLHINSSLMNSMIPRSVTTPIAMDVSSLIGGIPAITAIVVIMTGILGPIIGPFVIHLFHIDNDIARGILFGTAAHAAGTSKAFELSSVSGTISSVSMILAALFTLCLAPLLF